MPSLPCLCAPRSCILSSGGVFSGFTNQSVGERSVSTKDGRGGPGVLSFIICMMDCLVLLTGDLLLMERRTLDFGGGEKII